MPRFMEGRTWCSKAIQQEDTTPLSTGSADEPTEPTEPTDLAIEAELIRERPPSVANLSTMMVPAHHHIQNVYLIAPKYHLATCQIQKNMATIRMATFCYLNHTMEFIATNQSISTVFWFDKLCMNEQNLRNIATVSRTIGVKKTLFAVIRHPIDRFLSGYVDKCHNDLIYYTAEERCFGCKDDMRCFIETLHKVLVEFYNGTIERTRMVLYLVRHFAPQTWYCDFKDHKNDYILIRYKSGKNGTREVADEFDKVFRYAQIPKKQRAYIHSEMMRGTTPHSTSRSPTREAAEKELRSDDDLMRLIMQMYYYDFVEFGFG